MQKYNIDLFTFVQDIDGDIVYIVDISFDPDFRDFYDFANDYLEIFVFFKLKNDSFSSKFRRFSVHEIGKIIEPTSKMLKNAELAYKNFKQR